MPKGRGEQGQATESKVKMGEVTEQEVLRRKLLNVAEGVIDTLLGKREDYGTENIAITGELGLAVRLQDKVSRLRTLADGRHPNFESKRDTYADIVGYALIGLVPEGWGLSREE